MPRRRVSVLPILDLSRAIGNTIEETVELGLATARSAGRSLGLLPAAPLIADAETEAAVVTSALHPSSTDSSQSREILAPQTMGWQKVSTLTRDDLSVLLQQDDRRLLADLEALSGSRTADRPRSIFSHDLLLPSIIVARFNANENLELLYAPMKVGYVRLIQFISHDHPEPYLMAPLAPFDKSRSALGLSSSSQLQTASILSSLGEDSYDIEKCCVIINLARVDSRLRTSLRIWCSQQLSSRHLRGDRTSEQLTGIVGTLSRSRSGSTHRTFSPTQASAPEGSSTER